MTQPSIDAPLLIRRAWARRLVACGNVAACALLAIALVACDERQNSGYDADNQVSADEYGTGDVDAERRLSDAHRRSPTVLTVAVTPSGAMMPILPAGLTTFTVENTGADAEDCVFTLVPQTNGDYAASAGDEAAGSMPGTDSPRGTEAAGNREVEARRDAAAGDKTTGGARSDTSAGISHGEAGTGAMQGQQHNMVAAEGTAAIALDLSPGIYEVGCDHDASIKLNAPGEDVRSPDATPDPSASPSPREGMLVMVVDSIIGAVGPGINDPLDGSPGTEPEPTDIDQ